MKALLLTPGYTVAEVEVAGEDLDLLDAMCTVIGPRCELIERVRTRLTQPHLGNLVLAVDESGLYHDLPVNVLATLLYNPGWRSGQAGAIYGTALMLREEWNETEGGVDFASVRAGDDAVVRRYINEVAA